MGVETVLKGLLPTDEVDVRPDGRVFFWRESVDKATAKKTKCYSVGYTFTEEGKVSFVGYNKIVVGDYVDYQGEIYRVTQSFVMEYEIKKEETGDALIVPAGELILTQKELSDEEIEALENEFMDWE